ncbi:hypothetical protein A3B21_01275 [Candidatus Uhrbacteria bacterium RIFCSPLOWO2_01_FULL_47_24]|uniref:DUF3800 domain-containing protein n=1 Tax=Candidatus Uhrbacteria bacterium RIFCSPLOWO2_01_FULL_47_24 TaxID=1802401 RepID=A0A1F7US13_9BACT|nr:MAG: hypothetical protein A2753_03555 [Candidatus Uhrbacteria bacterium RIFCSPHIGHO2_01_FULL_47_11]OGL67733.1 MAG: hypothetical protein A3D58_01035 [Candidatus Uhrbacteria bacterium RIFCSPHIGHO2_02_FULL_46_47]OGL75675.1 MAG: hypothetical protein A3F52_04730 [Candidatus Uhrbacteria bacterium RIFCSPHIGHO2_12_FULL_47_11]OGL81025.1 MAG: hypothetical protein A3B21_01275 [Candidatus Uhrbacteria bacterium RIFCSPLOWO2_01_FULL_47_24]OGL84327.1 MAG: hypothetical protein A3J03_00340 [Candidatus Uhrbact
MQKLYCYVDEAGQDAGSEFFVVVAIVSSSDQETLRQQLTNAEKIAQTNHLKWHKISYPRRIQYLSIILEKKIAKGSVFTAHYRKPIPYFFPMLELLEKSIKLVAQQPYRASVYVDGIDRYKAKQLTNALRATGISLRIVKSKRDESEPLIRLADMWAGCIRSALLKHPDAQALVRKAQQTGYLQNITIS